MTRTAAGWASASLLAAARRSLSVERRRPPTRRPPRPAWSARRARSSGTTRTFNLVAKTGYIETPDGNSVFMWSYANARRPDDGHFQSPGPVLCANQGETVRSVNLTNSAGTEPSRRSCSRARTPR